MEGKAQFSRSGRAVVPKGSNSVAVSGIDGMTSGTLVLATLQRHCQGYAVESAVPDPHTDSFTVYLNDVVEHDTPLAWFVLS